MNVGCDARIKNGSRSLGSAANEETVGTARVTIRTRCRGGQVERKVGKVEVGEWRIQVQIIIDKLFRGSVVSGRKLGCPIRRRKYPLPDSWRF